MAQNALPQVPSPGDIKTTAALGNYIKQLYSTLSRWQLILNNTKFLGSASGHLTLSSEAPQSTDGEDEDIWIKY